MNRTAAQSLQGEQDDQEGLSKTGALAVSLCTTQTVGFSGYHLVSQWQELLQTQPGSLSAGRKGTAAKQWVGAENSEVKLRNSKHKVSSRKHFPG